MTDSELESIQILGIDAAVDPINTGLAVARRSHGKWRIDSLATGQKQTGIAQQMADLLDASAPVLLAIDAPLGWPTEFATSISAHRAGEPLDHEPRLLFSRETDRVVNQHTGLTPLSVSADRIARTAVAALGIVDALRNALDRSMPLLFGPSDCWRGGLIEVYPAATLKQRGLPSRGYKKPEARGLRNDIVKGVGRALNLNGHEAACLDSDHCLDAVLCVLTAIDFLDGTCLSPTTPERAAREGWIWFTVGCSAPQGR